jgi:phosphoglycolate phosphatase-like HAD superfamily hydrolase
MSASEKRHPPVVTIAALYGAAGSVIGPRVEEQLGVPLLDREVPEAVAKKTGIPGCRAHKAPTSEIFVIGDTPLDIQAAHAGGCTAVAVAVATGHYDGDALRKAGADHVLESLEQELPTG